jgi:transposase-like protein
VVEIITGVERRRNWRPEDKLRILAELNEPGAKFVDVARRNEVSRGLLWQWRDAQRRGTLVAEEAAFSRFLTDGRICLTNNAAERQLRGVALGRKAWMFAGSDRGGERAAAMYSLIATAKLNDVDPRAWLADVLARIANHPASRLHELLPWNWKAAQASPRRRGRLTVAAPGVVFTIARAAEMLGETVDLLDEIADQLEPEDGCLWIYDTDERATLGFTERGIESLKELIADQKR